MSTEKTYAEMRDEVLAKAQRDEAFRARLLADPKAAIADALGMALPDSVNILVHEDTHSVGHLVLPPSGRLTDANLEAIAAGSPAAYQTAHRHEDGEIHGHPSLLNKDWPY